ncbi:MAG: hypothetical protein K0Q95_786 [Bacteroidota bacterium]|jgi:hypothetical protein|nr:hypothetical protein [Bacteroidota bacterium]
MKNLFLFTALSVLLLSCDKKIVTEYRDVPALRASSIYRGDSIYTYMQTYKDANSEMAESYIKKSSEAESNDLSTATYFVKRAITLNPKLEYYKKLASLLERSGDYEELTELYYPIVNSSYIRDNSDQSSQVFVFGQPDQDTYYEYLVAEVAARGYLYGDLIYNARELGFDIPELKKKLFSDKRLKIDATSEETKKMMLLFLSDEELTAYNKLESTFKEMLSSIKDVSPVFEINKLTVRNFQYDEFNGQNSNYELEGPSSSYIYMNYLLEKREKPDSWHQFNFTHITPIGDSLHAVIYAVDTSENACPIDMRHIYHRLVIYNKKAEIIDSKIVALQSGEQLITLQFNTNTFTSTVHKREWKKPYNKKDFDNYVTGTTQIKETSFLIKPDGKIIEQPVLAVSE